MINIFKRIKVTFLDNEWKVLKTDVKMRSIPNIYELIYITEENKYYSVCNVIHNLKSDKCSEIFIIIEKYTDDYGLGDKKP